MSGKGNVAGFLYIPPLGAYKSQLGGTYILLLLVCMVNVHCDYSSCLLIVGVFARQMHSASEFAMIVLSKCVIHAGFVMVAWTLRGIPFQVGNLSLRPDLWIYNFQPSNSFSKVKQSAIFWLSPCRSLCWNNWPPFGQSPFQFST